MYAYEHAFSDQEAWDWLHNQQTRYNRDGFGLWAVVEKVTGEMVGQCGITWQSVGDGRQMPEVGYLLERAAWHKGYATEAAQALAVLGYSSTEVSLALKGVDVENLPLEEIIRQSLKKMVK